MKLYIFRHAIAEDRKVFAKKNNKKNKLSDDLRPLTRPGKVKFSRMIKQSLHYVRDADVLIQSPLLRSQQTVDIIAKQLKKTKRLELKNLSPGSSPKNLGLDLVATNYKKIILVGHEPDLGNFCGWLIGSVPLEFKKGGLCIIKIKKLSKLEPGSGKLIAFIPPVA